MHLTAQEKRAICETHKSFLEWREIKVENDNFDLALAELYTAGLISDEIMERVWEEWRDIENNYIAHPMRKVRDEIEGMYQSYKSTIDSGFYNGEERKLFERYRRAFDFLSKRAG